MVFLQSEGLLKNIRTRYGAQPMKKIKHLIDQTYHFFGSLKLAVSLLLTLSIILAAGTFLESYFSRAYAYNLIYGAFWFHVVLLLLATNILTAALHRLPYQTRLTGFYISHIGLLMILFGSLITLKGGVDASLTVVPGQFNKSARLDDAVLYVGSPRADQPEIQFPLPKTVFPQILDQTVAVDDTHSISITRFLPYAERKILFQKQPFPSAGLEVSLQAPFATQEEVLSFPGSSFPNEVDLGPLKIFFLGFLPPGCEPNPAKKWWVVSNQSCFFLDSLAKKTKLDENHSLEPVDLKLNQDAILIESKDQKHSSLFVPELSMWALKEIENPTFGKTIRPDFSSSFRVYANPALYHGNTLLFFIRAGELQVAAFQEKTRSLKFFSLKNLQTPVELPWMRMKLFVKNLSLDGIPILHYLPGKPVPGDDKPVSAVAVRTGGHSFWISSDMDVSTLPLGPGKAVDLFLGFRTLQLPWEFRLERFKMDKDPGSDNPASYESFVNIQTPEFSTTENAHIYMNNPLKKGGYTFFQASYFPISQDQFGSVLAVNKDPGRLIKYAGSLILVFGTSLHFYIRRARRAKPPK